MIYSGDFQNHIYWITLIFQDYKIQSYISEHLTWEEFLESLEKKVGKKVYSNGFYSQSCISLSQEDLEILENTGISLTFL